MTSGHPLRIKTRLNPRTPWAALLLTSCSVRCPWRLRDSGGDLPPLASPAALEGNLNRDAERLHETRGLGKIDSLQQIHSLWGRRRVKFKHQRKWGPRGGPQAPLRLQSYPWGCAEPAPLASGEVRTGLSRRLCRLLARRSGPSKRLRIDPPWLLRPDFLPKLIQSLPSP